MFDFFGLGRARKARRLERQSEMVHLALDNVLRHRGMTPHSIHCELVPMAQPRGNDLTATQLVILGWSEGLMRYAPDLENELFDAIHQFSRSALRSDFLFVWRFKFDGDRASDRHPDSGIRPATPSQRKPATTVLPVTPGVKLAATAEPAVKFNLPRSAFDDDSQDYGFPATVIDSR